MVFATAGVHTGQSCKILFAERGFHSGNSGHGSFRRRFRPRIRVRFATTFRLFCLIDSSPL